MNEGAGRSLRVSWTAFGSEKVLTEARGLIIMPFGNIDAIPHLFPLPSVKGEDVGQIVSKPNLPRPAPRGEGWGEGENNRKALGLALSCGGASYASPSWHFCRRHQ